MTNGDRIRQMSNEELANFIKDMCKVCIYADRPQCMYKGCKEGIKAYLDTEVAND